MFNVFLPKLLEMTEAGRDDDSSAGAVEAAAVMTAERKSLEESLWDVVIFTLGGCPGAIVSRFPCHLCQSFILFEKNEARGVFHRVAAGPQMVIGRQHVYHGVLLYRVCAGAVFLGGEG